MSAVKSRPEARLLTSSRHGAFPAVPALGRFVSFRFCETSNQLPFCLCFLVFFNLLIHRSKEILKDFLSLSENSLCTSVHSWCADLQKPFCHNTFNYFLYCKTISNDSVSCSQLQINIIIVRVT